MPAKQFTAFISYSHADGEELAKVLQQKINADAKGKEITFWQDYSQMKYGQWSKQIEDAIDAVEFLIMLITPGALASSNCKDEWTYARKNGVAILPINGEPENTNFYTSFPRWLGKQHIYHPKKNWERFINDLISRPETSKVPFMAPRLSGVSNYIERVDKLKRLKNLLLQADEPVTITTALQGSGGFGKTILTIALCNDDDIINAFDAGILWVTLGQQKSSALNAIQKLYNAISTDNKNFLDLEQAQQQLSEKLLGKDYLLVLDDVWYRTDAEAILKAAAGNAVLITTRLDKLIINAKQEAVDEMTITEAINLLRSVSGTNGTVNKELEDLAHRLGNWALLLRLAGGMLKARIEEGENFETAISFVNKKLLKKGLTGFDLTDADQRNDSVQICLSASIDLLNEDEKENLYSLGIFPEDENIPYVLFENYWEKDEFDSEELLEKLHHYGLIDLDVPGRTIKMHDILLKYYGSCLKDINTQHRIFIKRFGHFKIWTCYYLWRWCIWHLVKGDEDEEATNLLTDYYWIESKLKETGNLYYITNDFQLVPPSNEIKLIEKALLLSAAVLAEDPHQLPEQLFGRLGLMESTLCNKLAQEAYKAIGRKKNSLNPLHPNLEAPDLHKLVLKGHSSYVYGALMQDDILISWSADNTLRSWDILSGKTNNVFEGHSASVNGALVQGENLISWSYEKTFRSWDVHSGKIKQIFTGHSASVNGALIQGDTLISWSNDYTLRSWDILSGNTRQIFEGHSFSVKGALIQGDTLISWSDDDTLRSWDILSGNPMQVFYGHTDSIKGALIHDNTLISWSDDDTIRSWDIPSGKIKNIFNEHSAFINGGAFMWRESLISWSYGNTLCSWDILSGDTKQVFEGHSSRIIGALIQGDTLISWSYDKTLRSWDIPSGKAKQVFEGHSGHIQGALTEGDTLISWSDDKTLRSWDIPSGKIKKLFEGHSYFVKGALIQGDTLVSWSEDNILRLWNMHSDKAKKAFEGHLACVNGLFLEGDILISWSDDKTLRSWDNISGLTKQLFEGHSSSIEGAIVGKDIMISWSDDNTLRSWDIISGQTKKVFEGHSSWVNGALIQGDTLISWSNDKTVCIWDMLSGSIKQVLQENLSSLNGVLMHGDNLISWSENVIRSWDITSGKMKLVFEGHSSQVKGALIREDTLISWSADALCSWDIATGKRNKIFEGHEVIIYRAFLYGDSLISWGHDNTIQSWEIDAGKIRQIYHGHSSRICHAQLQDNTLISIAENELIVWNYLKACIIKRLDGKGLNQFQIHNKHLYIIDNLNSIWMYHFPSLEYVCRFTVDANITALQVAEGMNRIILGDASGRVHFLEPVGFQV